MYFNRLNLKNKGVHLVEEPKQIINGQYIGRLNHSNVILSSIQITTKPNKEGDVVVDYTTSQHSEKDWVTNITIKHHTDMTVYVHYETEGDVVDADDINFLQSEIKKVKSDSDTNKDEIRIIKSKLDEKPSVGDIVSSVNGEKGDVILDGKNIEYSSGDGQSLQDVISADKEDLMNFKSEVTMDKIIINSNIDIVDKIKWGKDELELGGRNYLTQAEQSKIARYNDFITTESKQENGLYVHEIVALTDVTVRAAIPVYDYKNFKEDDDITVSCDIKSTEELLVKLTQTTEDEHKVVKPNEWVRVSGKVDYGDRIGIYTENQATEGAIINIKNYKLEKGNIATPFSLAPEDLDEISTQTSPLANLDHIGNLYKQVIFNKFAPHRPITEGLVCYLDYTLQKGLVDNGLQDKSYWYDYSKTTVGTMSGFEDIGQSYTDIGFLLGVQGNRECIYVNNEFNLKNQMTFTVKFIPVVNSSWTKGSNVFFGFPFGTYTSCRENNILLNNSAGAAIPIKSINEVVEVTWVYKDSKISGYRNGIPVFKNRDWGTNLSVSGLSLGRTYEGNYASSLYQVVMIYNRALSDEEVFYNAVMNRSVNPSEISNQVSELREMIALRGLSR